MADDVDFVTVGAMWLHGKPELEKYHTRLPEGRFHGIKTEVLQVAVRFLRPDIAIVHWSWTAGGDEPGWYSAQATVRHDDDSWTRSRAAVTASFTSVSTGSEPAHERVADRNCRPKAHPSAQCKESLWHPQLKGQFESAGY
jgi:uncharacterized protein (TIGR02246 family)